MIVFYSLTMWLVPQQKARTRENKPSERFKQYIETNYRKIRSQWQLYAFLAFFYGVNIILFITRACYFRGMYMLSGFQPNVFYMLSRACGKFLMF